MSAIRCLYLDRPPAFPPTDQHPDAVRFGPFEVRGRIVYVDAVGARPGEDEIAALMPPSPGGFGGPGPPTITEAIEGLTDRVVAVRVLKEKGMAALPKIEIKGLGDKVKAARDGITALRASFESLGEETRGLQQDVADVTDQLRQHRADLRFEAETLGNGSGS